MENYEDRFDCDPADCNIGSSMSSSEPDSAADADEYSVNNVETTTKTGSAASGDTDSEAADDFGVDESASDETAATDLGTSDDGTSGDTDLSDLYESTDTQNSAAEDNVDEKTDSLGAQDYRWSDSESADETSYVDPSDETAAACDSDCDCGTTYAQKKCSLDDYEIISDVLGCEKQLVKLYSAALCESAEEPLRDIIKENLIEAAADQFATFEYMEKRGMYKTEQADEQKILQAKEQFCPLCD